MNTDTLTCAIVGHLVGDYLLQNDWMALNKKKSGDEGRWACAIHACIWSWCVVVFAGWLDMPMMMVVWQLLFWTHYIQDGTGIVLWWMTKVNRQQQFATGPCAPWSIIVVDNVWHIVTIWAIWRWVA